MGCASSTPMVATAGSEMLKAATHVAGEAKQKGEAAVEGVCASVCSYCASVCECLQLTFKSAYRATNWDSKSATKVRNESIKIRHYPNEKSCNLRGVNRFRTMAVHYEISLVFIELAHK